VSFPDSDSSRNSSSASFTSDGFDLLITSDQGIPYQHNWTGRSLGLLVLSPNDWNSIRRSQDRILAAVNAIQQSECVSFDVLRGE
jgi:hypothetical protein